MAVMVRSAYPDFYDSLLAALDTTYIQSKDLDESKAAWRKIFSIKKSKRQFENVSGISGFPQLESVGEGEDYTLFSVAQLFDKKLAIVA